MTRLTAEGRRSVLVVVLTALSGYVDAVGVVALGGAFTSVMTGNLVLTGIGLARGDYRLLVTSTVAIVCYLLGCMLGGRLTGLVGDGLVWPRVTSLALTVEFALLVVSDVGWWVLDPVRSPDAGLPLLFVNAVALGLQSAAVQRLGVAGMSTTFLTGTLTSLAIAVATGRPWSVFRRPLAQVLTLVAGGALGALLVLHAPVVVPAVSLLALAGVLLAAPNRPGWSDRGDVRRDATALTR